jgi:hypothetical protein
MRRIIFASFILVARTCFGKLILWIRGNQNLSLTDT